MLKLCVVARKEPDPVQGHMVRRRDLLDAKVYLGCVRDAYGLLDFVEIWVQDLEGFSEASRDIKLCAAAVHNTSVDDRWRKLFQVGIESWPTAMLATGWEVHNPPPTLLDVAHAAPVHPSGPDGPWELCRNDDVLKAADLPLYSTTLHRYLHQPRKGKDTQFVPVLAESPRKANVTIEYKAALAEFDQLVPFNPGGGLLLVRPLGTLGVADFTHVLGGGTYDGQVHGKSRFRVGPVGDVIKASKENGFLFRGRHDRSASRLVESLLLKLRLLEDLFTETEQFTRQAQRPLLNLRPDSFTVRLDAAARNLPMLWTGRALLTDPGDAVPLTIPQGEQTFRYHVPGRSVNMSIYQPSLVNRQAFEGSGLLMLSGKVDHRLGPTFKGTFTTTSDLKPVKHDILRIRVPVKNARVELYVKIDQKDQRPGVLPFVSVPDERLKPNVAAIEAAVGVPQHNVPFEFYPLLSSACDIYSLAIISTEVLLSTPSRPVASALAELLWFATSIAQNHKKDVPLLTRIASEYKAEKRWAETLGPQWVVADKVTGPQATRFIPPELWMGVLAWLVTLLPGHGPDSRLSNYGDVGDSGMHAAYAPIIKDLAALGEFTHSLLLGDWDVNRRIGSLLQATRHPV